MFMMFNVCDSPSVVFLVANDLWDMSFFVGISGRGMALEAFQRGAYSKDSETLDGSVKVRQVWKNVENQRLFEP